jgi:hypothetical protein
MKTPMQDLIEWLDKHGDNRIYGGRELSIHEIKTRAKSLLKKEKEVIMDAYIFGIQDEYVIGSHKYYNETFNTKEK